MFYDLDQYPFACRLEQNWRSIREEYERLDGAGFLDWPETDIYDHDWQVFGFCFFGEYFEANCRRCPRTVEILRAIPGLSTAGFSQMAPGTKILPHEGYTAHVLRCHLGLVVPEECGIKVGGVTKTWEEGKCLLFDDTVTHEAWNNSNEPRVVLLLDVARCAIASPDEDGVILSPAERRSRM